MVSLAPGDPDASSSPDAVDRMSPRRRKWLWLLVLIAVFAAAFFFAPMMVARHLLREGFTLSGRSGQSFHIRADDLSLGWFSVVRIKGVRIHDGKWNPRLTDQPHPLLTVESIESERPLFLLALDHSRPGHFDVQQPRLHVTVRADGSNLEDFIEVLLSPDRRESGTREIAITAHDGRIDISDPRATILGSIEDVELKYGHRFGTDESLDLEMTSVIIQNGQPRTLEAALRWRGAFGELLPTSGTGSAALKFDPVSLTMLRPHLARHFPEVTIHEGSLAGQFLIECDLTDAQTVTATGQLIARNVHASGKDEYGQVTDYQWAEEELAFHLSGLFDPQVDVIAVSDATLQSTPLSLSATGIITDVHGECHLDIDGDLQYDIDRLVQSLAEDYGELVRVQGLKTRALAIRGPLARIVDGRPEWDASRLSIEADVSWDVADIFGVRSEQATIGGLLQDGALVIEPLHVPVSGGRFAAKPRVTFDDGDPHTHFAAGPVLEDVALSPAMCRLWLKYLSPPMADATRIDGRFSLSLEQGRIPLKTIADGQLSGLLYVHTASLRPGPFAERIIGLVGTIRSLIDGEPGRSLASNNQLIAMDDQQIPFVMRDRRVHHERLEFTVAGAVVRTFGSIGFDDSLDLVISIPLPESWLTKADLRRALAGEVIAIPVQGSLHHPQFDLRPIRDLARRLALKATGGLLQKLLD